MSPLGAWPPHPLLALLVFFDFRRASHSLAAFSPISQAFMPSSSAAFLDVQDHVRRHCRQELNSIAHGPLPRPLYRLLGSDRPSTTFPRNARQNVPRAAVCGKSPGRPSRGFPPSWTQIARSRYSWALPRAAISLGLGSIITPGPSSHVWQRQRE